MRYDDKWCIPTIVRAGKPANGVPFVRVLVGKRTRHGWPLTSREIFRVAEQCSPFSRGYTVSFSCCCGNLARCIRWIAARKNREKRRKKKSKEKSIDASTTLHRGISPESFVKLWPTYQTHSLLAYNRALKRVRSLGRSGSFRGSHRCRK